MDNKTQLSKTNLLRFIRTLQVRFDHFLLIVLVTEVNNITVIIFGFKCCQIPTGVILPYEIFKTLLTLADIFVFVCLSA